MESQWNEYLEKRVNAGINIILPTESREEWDKHIHETGQLSVNALGALSLQANVLIDTTDNCLRFFVPGGLYDTFQKVKGIPTGTEYLDKGRALVGGPLVVGTDDGDLYFPGLTVTALVANSEDTSMVTATVCSF